MRGGRGCAAGGRSGSGILAPEIDDGAFEGGVGPGAEERVVADALRKAGGRGPGGLVFSLCPENVEGFDAEDGGEREDCSYSCEEGFCEARSGCRLWRICADVLRVAAEALGDREEYDERKHE